MMLERKKNIGGDIELSFNNISSTGCNTILDRLSFYASGRLALGRILENTHSKIVLVPSYICPSLYDYIKCKSTQVVVYSVDSRLRIEMDYLTELIHPGVDDIAMIVIDYFGVVNNDDDVMAIKDYFPDLTIIRDYSHNPFKILLPQNQSAEFISFASLRKFFPVPDGGVCDIKDIGFSSSNKLSLSSTLQIASKCLRGLYLKTSSNSIEWVEREYIELHELAEDILDSGYTDFGISEFTLSLLQRLDLEGIADARKSNYNRLRSALASYNHLIDLTLSPELSLGQVPYMLPLLLSDKTIRDLVKNKLHHNHIYCSVLWKLDNKCTKSYETSLSISDRILCLPIDQRYIGIDMMKVCESLMVSLSQY